MTFEEEMARLEAIASELDDEGVPLDRALALFAEGVSRLRNASSQLAHAEAEVALLVEQLDGTLATRPIGDDTMGSATSTGPTGRRQ